MADRLFSYMVKVGADVSGASSEFNKFSTNLKSKPLVIPLDLGTADTSQTEKFRDAVKAQAVGLDEIITKSKVIQNIKTGEQTRIATEQTRKWTDALGATFVETTKLDGAFQNIGKEFRQIGTETSTQKVTSQTQKLAKEWETADKTIQGMSNSAEKFLSKSENMTGKQVEGAQKTANALIEVTKQWDKAYGEKNVEELKRLKVELEKLNKEFGIQEAGTRRGAGALRGWAENVTNAWKQTIAYTFSLGSVRIAQQAFNQALRYTIDLNKEMVNIQILQAEGAQTPEEINSLAQSFNSLAKEMGATTLEVAKGSVEWFRQGKTIEETQQLLRASTMLSKLGNVEAADATEYLTSTINSFKMEAEDAVSIVDKLVAVDNIAATSTKELAVALRYVASVAGETGVTLEQLVSYIATISSVTRLNAESIGQAMKTMLTRMQDIRAGRIDEDGLGINNVEIALRRVNIELRETDTSFRDFGGVLEDLAKKWDTLNDIEQANISKAIAGVRQANMFRVLMTNMGQALEYQTEQFNASGLAMDRYKIYMDGVEAKQNQLKASMEGLYQGAIKNGLIQGFLDLGIEIIEIIDKFGGLTTILYGVVTAIALLKAQSIGAWISSLLFGLDALIVKAATATEVLSMLNLTMLANPWFLLAAGIAVVAGAIYLESQQVERLTKSYEKLSQTAGEASRNYNQFDDNISKINSLWKEFEKLRNEEKLTEEQTKRLIEVQNELNKLTSGTISGKYDIEMNFLIDKEEKLESFISLLERERDVKKEIATLSAKEAFEAGEKLLKELEKQKAEAEKVISQGGYSDSYLADLRSKMSEEEVQRRNQAYLDANKKMLAEIELQELQHVKATVDLYKSLSTEEERRLLLSVIKNKEAIDAITLYRSQEALKESREQKDPRPGREEELKLPVPNDTEFLEVYDRASEKVNELNELLSGLGDTTSIANAISDLQALGITVEQLADGSFAIVQESVDGYVEGIINAEVATWDLTDAQREAWQSLMDMVNSATYETVSGIQMSQSQYASFVSEVSSSIQGFIDYSKANIVDLNGVALTSSAQVTQAISNHMLTFDSLLAQLAKNGIANIDMLVNYLDKAAKFIMNPISNYKPTPLTFGGGSSGSSGGSNQKTPAQLEKERLQEEIKAHEKEKKLWKDRLDAFKKYIKAQKESLKLKKEERDFNRDLAKKSKDLAELQAEIALLALDNSEEAMARRLELEKEAAELSLEIEKDKEDRKYEVQVNALEAAENAYEEYINAILDGIDRQIEAIRELIDKIGELNGSGGGGGGTPPFKPMVMSIEEARAKLAQFGISMTGLKDIQIQSIASMIDRWMALGMSIQDVINKAREAARVMNVRNEAEGGFMTNPIGGGGSSGGIGQSGNKPVMHHQGGMVESHHNGEFAGNLRSNEVFSKLLKGEYVATEGQMNNFMKNILPKIASEMPSTSTSGMRDINVSMPITVEGNLDKSVIPDLDKIANKVIKEINSSLKQRGYIRQTTHTGYI